MNRLWTPIALLALASLLIACESTTPTTSGTRPQVTLAGQLGEQVATQLTGHMLDRGYNITQESPRAIIFEKPATGLTSKVVYGSNYNLTPNYRITAHILEAADTTRVVLDFAMITNPGSAHERSTPANQSPDTRHYQAFLDQLARSTARGR